MTIANIAPFSLSDDELRIEREKLEIWCTPQEFHNTVDALAAKFSLEDRFNSPRLAFLRDAILLAEFALKLAGAKSVRLATMFDQFPDGFVTTQDNKTLKVEVTEADHEDRRRGDEYKAGGKAKERPSDESEGVNVISKELERVFKRRHASATNRSRRLWSGLISTNERLRSMTFCRFSTTQGANTQQSFENIFLLWRQKLI
jgi:hypothetical protein